jgi:hypothetical protein
VAPAGVTVLSIVILQVTSYPAPVGKVLALHWLTVGAVSAAEETEAVTTAATPPSTAKTETTAAASKAADARRMRPIRVTRIKEFMLIPL